LTISQIVASSVTFDPEKVQD